MRLIWGKSDPAFWRALVQQGSLILQGTTTSASLYSLSSSSHISLLSSRLQQQQRHAATLTRCYAALAQQQRTSHSNTEQQQQREHGVLQQQHLGGKQQQHDQHHQQMQQQQLRLLLQQPASVWRLGVVNQHPQQLAAVQPYAAPLSISQQLHTTTTTQPQQQRLQHQVLMQQLDMTARGSLCRFHSTISSAESPTASPTAASAASPTTAGDTLQQQDDEHQTMRQHQQHPQLNMRKGGWGQTGSLSELEESLTAAALPEGVVRAIQSQAAAWPSLSKEPQEVLHRIDRLAVLLASRQAAYNMLATHPHVLTRPPGALQQQLTNLATWLRLPLAKTTTTTDSISSSSASSSSSSSGHQPDLSACQDLMGLVQRRPGVLFLSEQAVRHQLAHIQVLLQLPAPPATVQEQLAELESFSQFWKRSDAIAKAQLVKAHLPPPSQQLPGGWGLQGLGIQQQQPVEQPPPQQQQQYPASQHALLDVVLAIDAHSLQREAQAKQQQAQQRQQYSAALKAWRQAQQKKAQSAGLLDAAGSSSSDGGVTVKQHLQQPPLQTASELEAAIEQWPRRLVCDEPEWLSVDVHRVLPSRLRALQQLLSGPTPPPNSNSRWVSGAMWDARAQQRERQQQLLRNLLLRAPQLITVHGRTLTERVKALRKVLLQYLNTLNSSSSSSYQDAPGSPSPAAAAGSTDNTAAVGEPSTPPIPAAAAVAPPPPPPLLEWDSGMEELLLSQLYKWPQLLLQPAKQLEQRAAAVQQRLPLQMLDMLLQLLMHPQLHWQQLAYLQHTQQLPDAATTDPLLYSHTLASAVMQDPGEFSRQNVQFPAWQAASEAVDQAAGSRDWRRKGWGWRQEWEQELSGPAVLAWLREMEGKWQRLLLLAAGPPWLQREGVSVSGASAGSSSSGSKQRSTTTRKRALWPPVPLQQLARDDVSSFPYRPSDNLGPLLFDLPQQQLQQLLLRSNRPQLDAAISSSASIWQQLTAAAAAGHSAQWQQQLQDVRWLLPRALRTAGWLPNSSGVQFSGRAKSSSSRDWVSEVMASQTTSGDEATAAARRVFWQQLQQQPGLLSGLLDRLRFLRQLGPQAAKTAAQQAAPSAAAGDSANQPQQHQKQQPHQQVQANTQVRPGQLWDVLAASDAAFSAQFPPFCAWQRLARLVEDRPAWQQELSEMTGKKLLDWLPQADAAWDRLVFLTAAGSGGSSGQQQQQQIPEGSSSSSSLLQGGGVDAASAAASEGAAGEGGGGLASISSGGDSLWTTISLREAVRVSDQVFADMFPEAGFLKSWQALHSMQGGVDVASSGAGVPGAAASTSAAAAATGAATPPNRVPTGGRPRSTTPSAASLGVSKSQPDMQTAANRLRLLQDIAAAHPPWQEEMAGWSSSTWASAARLFTTAKMQLLDYYLHVHADTAAAAAAGAGADSSKSAQQQQQDELSSSQLSAAAAAAEQPPSLLALLAATKKNLGHQVSGGHPMLRTWVLLGDAVSAAGVPSWTRQWQQTRGADMQALLQGVMRLQAPGVEEVREAAKQQRLRELLRPVEPAAPASGTAARAGTASEEGEGPEGGMGLFSSSGVAAETCSNASSSSSSDDDDDNSSSSSDDESSDEQQQQVLPLPPSVASAQPSPGFEFTPAAYSLQMPGLVQLGVTGQEGLRIDTAATTAAVDALQQRRGRGQPRKAAGATVVQQAASGKAATAAAAAAAKIQQGKRNQDLPPGVALAAARVAFFAALPTAGQPSFSPAAAAGGAGGGDDNSAPASGDSNMQQQSSLQQLLTVPQAHLLLQHPLLQPNASLRADLQAAQSQGVADAEAAVLQQLHNPGLGPRGLRPEVWQGLSDECKQLMSQQPNLLPQLQAFAGTSPHWQSQLQDCLAAASKHASAAASKKAPAAATAVLEGMLMQLQQPERLLRLQVMVRCGLQERSSLHQVLTWTDRTWSQHYPIARQLAELQAAAQGVPAWERQLAREPSGPTLLQQIDGLHARRGRLAWLRKHQQQQQHKGSGSVASKHPSALAVLRMAQARFCGLYPDYPGDKK